MYLFFLVLLFTGCAFNREKPFSEDLMQSIKVKKETFQRSASEEGVYVGTDNYIYIKCKDKPFLSILDKLANIKRMNYTLKTDMHPFVLTIHDSSQVNLSHAQWEKAQQKQFKTINECLMYIVDIINENYQSDKNSISYRWTGDGPEFFNFPENSVSNEFHNNYLKKFFLNHLAVKEYSVENSNQYNNINNESSGDIYNNDTISASTLYDNNASTTQDRSIKVVLNRLVNKELTDFKIEEIETQNAIIVMGTKEVIDKISSLIYTLDVEHPQVLIEAKVFEYDNSMARQIDSMAEIAKDNETSQILFKSILLNDNSLREDFSNIFYQLSSAEKKFIILSKLSQTDRNVKILAEPRLLLKPGNRSFISMNTKKYVKVSGYETGAIKDIVTGIQFCINPIILGDNKIMLKVNVGQSEFTDRADESFLQTTNNNFINTTIIAQDGELINIGGIIAKKNEEYSSGIPILKDIPLLNYFVNAKEYKESKVRVDFMIRPTVKYLDKKLDRINQKVIHIN